jgi:hypothetical protein
LANFFGLYEAIVDGWQTYDNTDLAGPRLIASRPNSGTRVIADPVAWQKLTVLPMTDPEARTPAERVNDVERITEALRQGVREALRKQAPRQFCRHLARREGRVGAARSDPGFR